MFTCVPKRVRLFHIYRIFLIETANVVPNSLPVRSERLLPKFRFRLYAA